MSDRPDLVRHYGGDGFVERLDDALTEAGLGDKRLPPADLAPLDQFHARGLAATVELAKAVNIQPRELVIDIGSGLGGPSRYLAANYGCRVSGVDLSPTFVEAATYLAERAELSHKVDYRCANALALPFEDESFDVGWTQHLAMNIADRDGLYAEVFRVLRPGGRFAIYDVIAQQGKDVIFPVPWSRTPKTSFLLTPGDMLTALLQQGFRTSSWTDRSEAAIKWFDEQHMASAPGAPPTVGLHLAMGPEFPEMAANLERNLREGRVGLVQAIMRRP
jgi:SAM-dependent methyltransferase